jgi:hypothetical protein
VVTLKLLVQDANGYFVPNLRRENFAVYENGVRQTNATVEVEHSPVSMGLLLEFGGRYRMEQSSCYQGLSGGTQVLEIRPIIDKQIERWYLPFKSHAWPRLSRAECQPGRRLLP